MIEGLLKKRLIVEDWQKSQLPTGEFARRHELILTMLYRWRRDAIYHFICGIGRSYGLLMSLIAATEVFNGTFKRDYLYLNCLESEEEIEAMMTPHEFLNLNQ